MNKRIKLNSDKWCDMIFANRNKSYGAYKFRQSTSNDHIRAFIVAVFFLVFLTWLIKALEPKPLIDWEIIDGGCGIIEYMSSPYPEPPTDNLFTYPTIPDPPLDVVCDSCITKQSGPRDYCAIFDEHTNPDTIIKDSISVENIKLKNTSFFKEEDLEPILYEELKSHIDGYEDEDWHNRHTHPVEAMPAFPGGEIEFRKFLSKNIRYPGMSLEDNIDGRVIVQFTIDKTGRVINPLIILSLDKYCDKEVLRVINKMPKWIPAKARGNTINTNFVLPVIFKMYK
ncbi:energy transducer TonB [Dysgonomonas macrotermitis]|uniref:TonB family C-terminal domain-containing protein n=1 Tax=Dysgonomonas macrotermitis TaxID=1346286 RepID=A0A1M5BL11_9BACT|nr:energy transducer TonB [Dysgonomonas macrotermitis]SHF43126.1 TonB family C-terminal domain-containing protein [Dysgonomonas macrotermitis]